MNLRDALTQSLNRPPGRVGKRQIGKILLGQFFQGIEFDEDTQIKAYELAHDGMRLISARFDYIASLYRPDNPGGS